VKLTIRAKIIGLCGILLAALLVCVAIGVRELQQSNARTAHIVDRQAQAALNATKTRIAMAKATRAERDVLLGTNEQRRQASIAATEQFNTDRETARKALGETIDPSLKPKLDELDAAWRNYIETQRAARALKLKASNERAAKLALGDAYAASIALRDRLTALDAQLTKELGPRSEGSEVVAAAIMAPVGE